MRKAAALYTFLASTLLATLPATTFAQTQTIRKMNTPPANLETEPFMLDESVLRDQWPNTLPLINIPPHLTDLSPGQCLRIGVVSSGENAAGFLNNVQIEFKVTLDGKEDFQPLAPAEQIKQLKPEGSSYIQGALDAIKIDYQLPPSGAIAASAAKWCVPAQAPAGPASIETWVVLKEKRTALKTMTLNVFSPEMPGPSPIKDDKTMNDFSQHYYRNPQPEFLPSFSAAIFEHDAAATIFQQAILEAMKRNPIATARLGPQLASATPQVQAIMVKLAKEANVTMPIPFELSASQKEFIRKLADIPNPYDITPNTELFGKQDQLWAIFTSTGDITPIKTLIGMLAWHSDYDAFQKLLAAKIKIPAITPEIARGLAYTSAGWSLRTFQRSDPLLADYIAAYLADPKNPDAIKTELRNLGTNPAFIQH